MAQVLARKRFGGSVSLGGEPAEVVQDGAAHPLPAGGAVPGWARPVAVRIAMGSGTPSPGHLDLGENFLLTYSCTIGSTRARPMLTQRLHPHADVALRSLRPTDVSASTTS